MRASIFSKYKTNPLVFFAVLCATTALSFHALAAGFVPVINQLDPAQDKDLPEWCPPAPSPGLAVICGEVVTSGSTFVYKVKSVQQPISNVMVAAYEDNPISSTGNLSGRLTNIFSSTKTNKAGRFRLLVRRITPNLRNYLYYSCGSAQNVKVIDSWHNWWGMSLQLSCSSQTTTSSAEEIMQANAQPPFPLDYSPTNPVFLGCDNNVTTDTAVGLERHEEPVINTIAEERNFDHRFNMNTVSFITNFGGILGSAMILDFTSPGGLWEPDCLLRNKRGEYLCNVSEDSLGKWRSNWNQPCTIEGKYDDCGITPGYLAQQLYARSKINFETDTPEPNTVSSISKDVVDGVLYDGSGPMEGNDYVTRPFFKYIPKSKSEYTQPFRAFEYRNNMSNPNGHLFSPMQWRGTYLGNSDNSASGPPTMATFRRFMGAVPEEPILPSCDLLRERNLPDYAGDYNRLINAGFMTALAQPYGTLIDIYYSGQKDLTDYVCEMKNGRKIRLSQIQVPWGDAAICDVTKPNCRDGDIESLLHKSLNRLYAHDTLIDPETAKQVEANIRHMLGNVGTQFILDKSFFPIDLMFKGGNTQFGLHSDTPNDSIGKQCERRGIFEPAKTEQACGTLTGSRVIQQGGGLLGTNSVNTILCAINAQWCVNDSKIPSLDTVLDPPFVTTPEETKKVFLDHTTWRMDDLGPRQATFCSVSNTFIMDIKGPIEEALGLPTDDHPDSARDGGQFDNLWHGGVAEEQRRNMIAGNATWYMSQQAIDRDEVMAGSSVGGIGTTLGDLNLMDIAVGTDRGWLFDAAAFGGLLQRDVWDSVLRLSGGDANLHNMHMNLQDVQAAITASLAGGSTWKNYADRQMPGSGKPADKPYYEVKFEYPLDEANFKKYFRLPGEVRDGDGNVVDYVRTTPLDPSEWGPGHICYNFDTKVSPGHIGGTLREPPEGLSRTTRVDKCRAYYRKESAICTCEGPDGPCDLSKHETRNLFVEDCDRELVKQCAQLQETTLAWEFWHPTYGPSGDPRIYNYDTLTNRGPSDRLPPDDIDGKELADDHSDHYDPPHIEKSDCKPTQFRWGREWDGLAKNKTIWGASGATRPKCEASVAGPFRRDPNFIAAGEQEPALAAGAVQKNCNGIITVQDNALRASQYAPLADYGKYTEGQIQHNIDGEDGVTHSASTIGLKAQSMFSRPYSQEWGGEKLKTLDMDYTNNGMAMNGFTADLYSKHKLVSEGGRGDVHTVRRYFGPPTLVYTNAKDSKLKDLTIHCDTQGSYKPGESNAKTGNIQREKLNVLETFDPDMDGFGGWICKIENPPEPQIPAIDFKYGSCQVHNYIKCNAAINRALGISGYTEEDQYKFSTWSRRILDWAADQTEVPIAAILGVMYLEGGLNPQYVKYWNDDAWAFNSGVPWWGQMRLGGPATADNLTWTATGPLQILQHWMNAILDDPKQSVLFCSQLNSAGGGRCQTMKQVGRTNLLDTLMLAGWLLKPGGTCGAYDFKIGSAAFSGGSYNSENAAVSTAEEIFNACQ